jgi:hypothetical protein
MGSSVQRRRRKRPACGGEPAAGRFIACLRTHPGECQDSFDHHDIVCRSRIDAIQDTDARLRIGGASMQASTELAVFGVSIRPAAEDVKSLSALQTS